MLDIGSLVCTGVGWDLGTEVSKMSARDALRKFGDLKWTKKILIILFVGAISFGVYLRINPLKIENEALSQATVIAEKMSNNFAAGFVATVVLKKIKAELTSNHTARVDIELDDHHRLPEIVVDANGNTRVESA